MTFKTLLLGSAAAVVTFGGAQAADLGPVPEPVNYVRACDALGAGYWYAPGTETCIKIGGYVRFTARFGDSNDGINAGVGGVGTSTQDDHAFETRANLNVTANAATEWGPLIGYLSIFSAGDGGTGANTAGGYGRLDQYISLGPVFVGYAKSIFADGGAGGYTVVNTSNAGLLDRRVDQARLDWAFNGFKVQLAAQDYRDLYQANMTGAIPDLVGKVSASLGLLEVGVSAAYGDRFVNDTWGVSAYGVLNLDMIAKGDRLKVVGTYAEDGGDWIGLPELTAGDYYGLAVSAKHVWTSNLSSAATAVWADTPTTYATMYSFSTTFTPVKNLDVTGEVTYFNPTTGSDYTIGYVRLQRNFP